MSRLATIGAYLTAAASAGVLAWLARRPRAAVPGFMTVCTALLHYRVGRAPVGRMAVLGLWWWVGWHFFAR